VAVAGAGAALRLLRRERIDVLHSHKFGANVWGVVMGRLARVPVIVVSADTSEDRVDAVLTGGASDFLAKPLELHSLLHAVDVQLETRHTVF
jgi:DNA-binding response OmpR family regulator